MFKYKLLYDVCLCMFATTLRYRDAAMLHDTLLFGSKHREEYDCEQVTRSRSSDWKFLSFFKDKSPNYVQIARTHQISIENDSTRSKWSASTVLPPVHWNFPVHFWIVILEIVLDFPTNANEKPEVSKQAQQLLKHKSENLPKHNWIYSRHKQCIRCVAISQKFWFQQAAQAPQNIVDNINILPKQKGIEKWAEMTMEEASNSDKW